VWIWQVGRRLQLPVRLLLLLLLLPPMLMMWRSRRFEVRVGWRQSQWDDVAACMHWMWPRLSAALCVLEADLSRTPLDGLLSLTWRHVSISTGSSWDKVFPAVNRVAVSVTESYSRYQRASFRTRRTRWETLCKQTQSWLYFWVTLLSL